MVYIGIISQALLDPRDMRTSSKKLVEKMASFSSWHKGIITFLQTMVTQIANDLVNLQMIYNLFFN